jgi:filamentous hemagglutinin family protein
VFYLNLKNQEIVMNNENQSPAIVNGVNTNQVMNLAGAIQSDNDYGQFVFRAKNQWQQGSQSSSSIQNFYAGGKEDDSRSQPFHIETDQPGFLAGKNTAPNPVEHLLHSLGSCLTTTLTYHAAVQGIDIDQIESNVEGDLDARGFFGIADDVNKGYKKIRAHMRVKSDADVETLTELAMFSPVYEMLSRSVPVEFSLVKI